MSSVGKKVTSDPAAKNAIPEAVGTVTSDSLAAESHSFGAGNPKAGISQQPSRSSTLNTTDTSAARKLEPAENEEAREMKYGWGEDERVKRDAGLEGGEMEGRK
ncbi:uncharacterized protein EI97DRAFT_431088 [Westerdykella ornata]|uniref:Uncharacterized protein n=1 Tax=Westerdykella ornata TaxID=318751 RepID=A0A6A6JUX2_WESOR|nr:uncharacterized protein EI97DRAFT_431088 [Westerdykella ornata]KAF2278839.1 hypothetical protein EI97DRAFT_431088 [Westerdykella ornata]